MRAGIRTAPVIVFSTWLLTSCAPGDTTCGGACGSLIVDINAAPNSILPITTATTPEVVVSGLVYLPLADIGMSQNVIRDVDFEPRLARGWTFEDPVTLVFELDERARWQDGVPVTAGDVAFAYDLFRDPEISVNASELTEITAVEIRDDHTIAFAFARQYPEQFYDVVFHIVPMPAHLLDTIPRENLAGHPLTRAPIGNGPYRVARWDAPNAVELAADTSFFLGRPGIARILFQTVPARATSITRLVAGETDLVDFLGGPPDVERVASSEGARVLYVPAPVYMYIAFNFRDPAARERPHPLFSDVRIRRAIAHAIDRDAILQSILGGKGGVPFGPVTQANPLWSSGVDPLAYDTSAAAALLDDAGWTSTDADGYRVKDGRRLSFRLIYPPGIRQAMAVIVESQLRAVGIEAILEEPDFSTFNASYRDGNFDAAFGGWGQSPKILGAIRGAWASDGPQNYGRWSNAEFDSLLTRIDQSRDGNAQRTAWADAFRVLRDDAPAVWVINPLQAAGINNRFDNVSLRPDNWGATIWQWTVPRDRLLPRDQIALR